MPNCLYRKQLEKYSAKLDRGLYQAVNDNTVRDPHDMWSSAGRYLVAAFTSSIRRLSFNRAPSSFMQCLWTVIKWARDPCDAQNSADSRREPSRGPHEYGGKMTRNVPRQNRFLDTQSHLQVQQIWFTIAVFTNTGEKFVPPLYSIASILGL